MAKWNVSVSYAPCDELTRLHVKLVLDAPNVTSACSRAYSIAKLAAEDAIGYAPPIVHVAADLMDGETIG